MNSVARRRTNSSPRPSARLSKSKNSLLLVPPAVKKSSKRPMMIIVSLFIGLLASLILVPLLINTQLAILSYDIHADEVEINRLNEQNQSLRATVINQSSPERVREIAEENGLIPAGETGYITLADKSVVGGEPAEPPAPEEPLPAPKPKEQALLGQR